MSYNLNLKKILIWGSRETDNTIDAVNSLVSTLANAVRASGVSAVTVRPITYQDLGLSAPTLGMSIAAGATNLLSNFSLQPQQAIGFYGWRDFSSTLTIYGLQFQVGSVTLPSEKPLPVSYAWTDQEKSVYFSPVPIIESGKTIQITIYSYTSNSSASFQLLGYKAEPGIR